jgi:hypothetical protein
MQPPTDEFSYPQNDHFTVCRIPALLPFRRARSPDSVFLDYRLNPVHHPTILILLASSNKPTRSATAPQIHSLPLATTPLSIQPPHPPIDLILSQIRTITNLSTTFLSIIRITTSHPSLANPTRNTSPRRLRSTTLRSKLSSPPSVHIALLPNQQCSTTIILRHPLTPILPYISFRIRIISLTIYQPSTPIYTILLNSLLTKTTRHPSLI